MKHTRKNKKKAKTYGSNREYWGTRDAKHCRQPGKDTKVLTHRRERRKGRGVKAEELQIKAQRIGEENDLFLIGE